MASDTASQKNRKAMPRPPPQPQDAGGVAVALFVITCWAATYYYALFHVQLFGVQRSRGWVIAVTFLALEYLYTGLFITTHDAMHGAIAFKNKRVNDAIGRTAISLYAWFDYDRLYKKHWEHHDHTGRVGEDPDFHRGDPSLAKWFTAFMWEYLTWQQMAKITVQVEVLNLLFGVPMINIILFMAGAGLLSAFRLFYYGTYLPHCPNDAKEVMNWQKSRTSGDSELVSMLKCYHFDCHWEHHRWPYAPWWQLYKYRQYTRAHGFSLAASEECNVEENVEKN